MRNRFAIALLLLAAGASAAETTKRPMTHADYWQMPRVSNPVVSPDGKWVVFSVAEQGYEARDDSSDLWIVPSAGGVPPRRLTSNRQPEIGVEWSPDSQKIAFSARRTGDETGQIYVLDLAAGGEAERITNLSTGARVPHWSPDGRRLMFVSEVYPGAGDDEANRRIAKEHKERRYNARTYDSFPVRYWDRWLDERRPHLFVQDASAGAKPHDLISGTALEKIPGFGGRLSEAGEELPATWTPDGKQVLFVASVNRDQMAYSELDTDLFLANVEGGEPQRLTSDPDSYGRPIFTPDGKGLIVMVIPGGNGFGYNLRRLARYPWPFDVSGRTVLTAEFDRAPNDPVVAPQSDRVYFTAEDTGLEKLYSVSLEHAAVAVASETGGGVLTSIDGGGIGDDFRIAALWDSATFAPEVFIFRPGDKKPHQLTHFTEERMAKLDLFPVEHFWFQNSRGQRIHNLVIRPAGFDPGKKYPLIAFVHGGPYAMVRDSFGQRWNCQLLAATGNVVVLTNYTGSSGFGETFSRTIQGSPLKAPADDVNEAVDEVLHRYAFADPARVAAVGSGYGGHIVNWIEATSTRYRCLVAHAALANMESQWGTSDLIYDREVVNGGPVWEQGPVWREENPVRHATNHTTKTGWMTPILLTAGEKDFRVPINNTLETWSYLQRLQVPSRLIIFPDENHAITRGEDNRHWYSEVEAWLSKWMEPAATP